MTQPVQEPTQGRVDAQQGFASRQLFRRPAPPASTGGADNISALGIAYGRSQTATGSLKLEFDEFWQNDASFGYTQVTSSRAKYITISEEGWYEVHCTVFWNTDFSGTDFPYIQPSCWFVTGSFADVLVNSASPNWNDTNGIIYGEQFTTAEYDHHALSALVQFQFDATALGTTVFGLGINLNTSGGSFTKNYGGAISVTRIGELLTQTSIV